MAHIICQYKKNAGVFNDTDDWPVGCSANEPAFTIPGSPEGVDPKWHAATINANSKTCFSCNDGSTYQLIV